MEDKGASFWLFIIIALFAVSFLDNGSIFGNLGVPRFGPNTGMANGKTTAESDTRFGRDRNGKTVVSPHDGKVEIAYVANPGLTGEFLVLRLNIENDEQNVVKNWIVYSDISHNKIPVGGLTDIDFQKKEVRLWNTPGEPLWGKTSDTLLLLDSSGRVVDEHKYP